MGPADLQAREAVERAVEDHAREEQRRLQRIADDVAEVAASTQRALANDVVGADGVNEDEHAELFGLGPERVVLRQRGALAGDVSGDADAAQAEPSYGFVELLGGEIGMLERHRAQAGKPIG